LRDPTPEYIRRITSPQSGGGPPVRVAKRNGPPAVTIGGLKKPHTKRPRLPLAHTSSTPAAWTYADGPPTANTRVVTQPNADGQGSGIRNGDARRCVRGFSGPRGSNNYPRVQTIAMDAAIARVACSNEGSAR